jgi:NAD(P)-dependent dehydrogenase (short-subunit alcohol dehydrogenase family)
MAKVKQPRKVVAVTGGGQGIGRGLALAFAGAGYAVSLSDIAADAGRETTSLIGKIGGTATFVRCDVSREGEVSDWVARTLHAFGHIDVLVNNAGIAANGNFLSLKARDFDRVVATNLRGTFLCSQAVARHMVKRKAGTIINMASTRAFMSEPNTEAYTASKGGIYALTHGMAISLGKYGIRVNSLSPGWIEVRDWQYSKRARKPYLSRADQTQHPVGRVGRPEDIAEACLFLAERAGFLTGQNSIVDGGMSVKMIYAD